MNKRAGFASGAFVCPVYSSVWLAAEHLHLVWLFLSVKTTGKGNAEPSEDSRIDITKWNSIDLKLTKKKKYPGNSACLYLLTLQPCIFIPKEFLP